MENQNIVCFAKDWHEDPTSNNHVMRNISKRNNVLWLNSIATRAPSFSSGRDWGKIFNKLSKLFSNSEQVEDRLWTYTPLVLPFPFSSWAHLINALLLKYQLKRITRKLKFDDFQLWTFLPTAQPYFNKLNYTVGVYYCIDEWSEFSELNTEKTVAMENALCKKVDVVFATAYSLLESRKKYTQSCYLARHGVDYEHFSNTKHAENNPPKELLHINGPIIGFMGLVHDWVDQDLIVYLAKQRPQWSIVILGNATVNIEKLENVSNIILCGRIPYEKLPEYIQNFSVGIIPFKINELTRHINPIKLREYLSAGLPVVSTPLDEAEFYKPNCALVSNKKDFLNSCEEFIKNDTHEKRLDRSSKMKNETWEAVVDKVEKTVEKYI
ncbi:MAG: glycosyltransferase [Gammaproteobacteria bacterium]|nr:MAG: glycosyltransferase [Gammaproteobacteria bacterium]